MCTYIHIYIYTYFFTHSYVYGLSTIHIYSQKLQKQMIQQVRNHAFEYGQFWLSISGWWWKEIKKQAKVEVNIPAVPKNGPAGKKYRVTLAGSKASVTLGKEIINSIALYHVILSYEDSKLGVIPHIRHSLRDYIYHKLASLFPPTPPPITHCSSSASPPHMSAPDLPPHICPVECTNPKCNWQVMSKRA